MHALTDKSALIVCVQPVRLNAYHDVLSQSVGRVFRAGSFELAKEALTRVRPDALITEIALREHNGFHLALWARVHYPATRSILIGGPDAVLEHDAPIINAWYIRTGDPRDVMKAVVDALVRDDPRRRWRRRLPGLDLAMDVGGLAARVIDLSYGGFRCEVEGPPPSGQVPVAIPRFDLQTQATCVWSREKGTPGAYLCGAAVREEDTHAGSRWRAIVDAVATPPSPPLA
jgi:hypothetical protein